MCSYGAVGRAFGGAAILPPDAPPSDRQVPTCRVDTGICKTDLQPVRLPLPRLHCASFLPPQSLPPSQGQGRTLSPRASFPIAVASDRTASCSRECSTPPRPAHRAQGLGILNRRPRAQDAVKNAVLYLPALAGVTVVWSEIAYWVNAAAGLVSPPPPPSAPRPRPPPLPSPFRSVFVFDSSGRFSVSSGGSALAP